MLSGPNSALASVVNLALCRGVRLTLVSKGQLGLRITKLTEGGLESSGLWAWCEDCGLGEGRYVETLRFRLLELPAGGLSDFGVWSFGI